MSNNSSDKNQKKINQLHSQTHFPDQFAFNESAMSREAYERTKENLKNSSKSSVYGRPKHTFDPIYFPLEQYKDFYDYRRPDIEQLEDAADLVVGAAAADKRKNNSGTLRSWWSSVYHTNSDNIPKRKQFEDAIDTFIDENYLIGSKLKRQMQEIEELCEQIEIGVEVTEDFALVANDEQLTLVGDEIEAGVDPALATSDDKAEDSDKTEPQSDDMQADEEASADKLSEEPENKTLAPFIHRKYMKEDHLLPLPWMTKKIQAYPFLPPNHLYVVRHVFGLSLEDTICRCVWFENDGDLSYELRYEYPYLAKIEEWRQRYSSEELDCLLNHNCRLTDDAPVVDLYHPKLDLGTFDLGEFERQLAVKRALLLAQIRSQAKVVKDCTRKVPELGDRRHSKSFIKDFLRSHSISKTLFLIHSLLKTSSSSSSLAILISSLKLRSKIALSAFALIW